jgi:hypothetical protein
MSAFEDTGAIPGDTSVPRTSLEGFLKLSARRPPSSHPRAECSSSILAVPSESLTKSAFGVTGAVLRNMSRARSSFEELLKLTAHLSPSSYFLRKEYDSYATLLERRQMALLDALQLLFTTLLDDTDTNAKLLLSSPEAEGWRDPRLASLLKTRLANEHRAFLECMEKMGEVVGELQLDLSHDLAEGAVRTSSIYLRHRGTLVSTRHGQGIDLYNIQKSLQTLLQLSRSPPPPS